MPTYSYKFDLTSSNVSLSSTDTVSNDGYDLSEFNGDPRGTPRVTRPEIGDIETGSFSNATARKTVSRSLQTDDIRRLSGTFLAPRMQKKGSRTGIVTVVAFPPTVSDKRIFYS